MKFQSIIGKVVMVSFAGLALSGCAREISSDVYKASHVGEASRTYPGIIIGAREVDVKEGERLEDNSTGAGLGALAGGVGAATTIGSGNGSLAAAAAGAVLGGVAGALAERRLKEQKGIEYIVQLNDGSMMTVVQGPEPILQMGQTVFVLVSHSGRSRVVADMSYAHRPQALPQQAAYGPQPPAHQAQAHPVGPSSPVRAPAGRP